MNNAPHLPIMVEAILSGLRVSEVSAGLWIDGTVGAGGHSAAILSARDDSRLLGLDRDPAALKLASERLKSFGGRAQLRHDSYVNMGEATRDWLGEAAPLVDGILLDLGLSSMQLDQAERGFSFRYDAPLDMRFDPSGDGPTAADLLNSLDERQIADLLYQYGEERDSRRIAKAIIAARPIQTTGQLADLIAHKTRTPRHQQHIHPATRSFQALRIAVNDELGAVERVVPLAIELLKSGGRLAIISFHSLEDRIVKNAFKLAATDCICPPQHPICTCGHVASVKPITRKPLIADGDEVALNSRARSAKLRIVEKL